ncbi:chemotaxis protein CheB [Pseudanabaena sp. FACHB-2040]|uniref:chemotaxis protein CheB n=1 Tax=Pseudanabaena sp. FACHB-2040 TaxID=2692859 RepID=UPI0016847027|nr:chemotaxis protein CheB [Pseudanabaena sp. FACHB-2040]MBD2256508.1 chemotaxis protein CheB [Pseudanabaena sp. FACHB-2040]
MPHRNIVVIGASAGGVETSKELVSYLPPDLAASLFVAMHFPANSVSILPSILNRCGTLPALHPEDGTAIEPGRIYVAPPNYHMELRRRTSVSGDQDASGYIVLDQGPRENGYRPAIDFLFRSAARTYHQRVIGVILSGMLDDGTAGLMQIKARGGVVLVQDPQEALFSGMPNSAIANVKADAVLPIAKLAAHLVEIIHETVPEEVWVANELNNERERERVAQEKSAAEQGERPDSASPFTCPECGGVLWELRDRNLLRFRCHVGHVYSPDSMLSEQANDLERALWSGVRALEERAALARRMANHAHEQKRWISEAHFLERAEETAYHAQQLRQVIAQQTNGKPNKPGDLDDLLEEA